MNLTAVLPNAEALLQLDPEELGEVLLLEIQRANGRTFQASDPLYQIELQNSPLWPSQLRSQIRSAIAEGFAWLERELLTMKDPGQLANTTLCVLTRRGAALKTAADLQAYREAGMLPGHLIHSSIVAKVRPLFMRGDHPTAVFQAFKSVEVAVRRAAGLPESLVGTKLMQEAFRENGRLTDMKLEPGERVAILQLFTGAIGHAKNPGSHREIEIDRTEAARLIVFASHLLEIVETAERRLADAHPK